MPGPPRQALGGGARPLAQGRRHPDRRHLHPPPPAEAQLGQGAGVARPAAFDGDRIVKSRWLLLLAAGSAAVAAQDPLAPLPQSTMPAPATRPVVLTPPPAPP